MSENKYLEWLKQDELEIILQALEKDAKSQKRQDIYDESLQLSGRFYRLEKLRNRKTATEEELEVERNKLREALKSLVDQLCQPENKLKIHQDTSWRRWRTPLFLFLVSFALVCVGLLPVKKADFRIKLQTEYLAFRLAGHPPKEIALPGKRAEFYALARINGSNWNYQADGGDQPLEAQLDTGWLSLEGLNLEPEKGISLRISGQDLTFAFEEPMSGRLQADKSQVKIHPFDSLHPANPDLIEWILAAGGEVSIGIRPDSVVQLLRLPIQTIDFQRPFSPGSETLQSGIQGGKIFIGNSIDSLKVADQLLIEGLQHAELNLYSRGQVIQVELQGQARELRSGLGLLRSHKPKWLVFLKDDQLITLIISSLVYLTGLLWTIKKAIDPASGK